MNFFRSSFFSLPVFLIALCVCVDIELLAENISMQQVNMECYYVHSDRLQSAKVLTDSAGLKQHYEYKAFGGERFVLDTENFVSSRRFTDQVYDEDTGLYYYGARYYDPFIGRFLQADSLIPNVLNSQDFNSYGYVRNNPFLYVDPTGNLPVSGGSQFRSESQYQRWKRKTLETLGVISKSETYPSHLPTKRYQPTFQEGVQQRFKEAEEMGLTQITLTPQSPGLVAKTALGVTSVEDVMVSHPESAGLVFLVAMASDFAPGGRGRRAAAQGGKQVFRGGGRLIPPGSISRPIGWVGREALSTPFPVLRPRAVEVIAHSSGNPVVMAESDRYLTFLVFVRDKNEATGKAGALLPNASGSITKVVVDAVDGTLLSHAETGTTMTYGRFSTFHESRRQIFSFITHHADDGEKGLKEFGRDPARDILEAGDLY